MCLAIVDSENKKLSIGYKAMVKHSDGSLSGEYRMKALRRPLGEWLHSKNYDRECTIESSDGGSYECGWHIYCKKKDAERERDCSYYRDATVVVRVRVRDIVASGSGLHGDDVVVSKQILITGEV